MQIPIVSPRTIISVGSMKMCPKKLVDPYTEKLMIIVF